MTMQRKLGRSGIDVSAMGIGCWAIGGPWTMGDRQAGWGVVDDNESIRALHAAFEHGITFYDTAANYGAGHSEVILGRAFADRRDRVVIATKFGYMVDEGAQHVEPYDGDVRQSDVVSRLRGDVAASLRRLNTDVIDLYQFHINDFPPERAPEVRDLLEELVDEGLIRAYGWSTDHPEGARVFAQGPRCTAIQHNLNVIHDSADILAVCDEFDLACINRGPLGMGLLTGKYDRNSTWDKLDTRSGTDWFREGFFDQILPRLDDLRAVLTSNGRTLAQGALAWLWGRSERNIPIPGVRTVAQVEENAGAMDFGPLTADQMRQIEEILGRTEQPA